jgi:hypothetical protein
MFTTAQVACRRVLTPLTVSFVMDRATHRIDIAGMVGHSEGAWVTCAVAS